MWGWGVTGLAGCPSNDTLQPEIVSKGKVMIGASGESRAQLKSSISSLARSISAAWTAPGSR
jgi:hypothetical protein